MAGPQSAFPMLGCFGAEGGAESGSETLTRNFGFTELLSRKGPQSIHFLYREGPGGPGVWRGGQSVCECGGSVGGGADPGFEEEAVPWFLRHSLEGGGDRCTPGRSLRWEPQTQLQH